MPNDEPPLDDIESSNGSAVVGCPSSEEENALNRLLSEFNLSEFLALANRVIDEAPAVNGCTPFLVPHFHSFPADYGSYSACTSYSTNANDRTMNAYLLHTPSVAASFPVPLLSLPPSSMASSIFPVSAAAANPSAAIHCYYFGRLPTRSG
ncbi:hypothetical protein Salat_0521300 [Sesamum alatum]|uniref:Uncharacterized protein n=1 Tax=Sesamum alatum TaxID=300844 RepID=A0AAE1Z5I8_9LAMI|nr:hypothetical protein Salat_0521300 [Sesamum alatum]